MIDHPGDQVKGRDVILHKFPNPDKEPDLFRTWIYAVGGDILALDNGHIYKYRRVCHVHFEPRYYTWSNRLSANAVPTIQLSGFHIRRTPFMDISNNMSVQANTPSNIEANDLPMPSTSGTQPKQGTVAASTPNLPGKSSTMRTGAKCSTSNEATALTKEIEKLRNTKDRYAIRLKKALKLSENSTFQNALKKFTTLAALFTTLQFREITKEKMGRRFTNEEKIMALTVYKLGPRAYRWLRKIFVLPSPVTLSRMVSRASLKPGINDNLFKQLKKKVDKMKPDDKLCTLLFDEMSLSPHLEYNRKKDKITGFVNNGTEIKRDIADHVLVFMIRGIAKNYKQPIAYSFCSGSTKKNDLKNQIEKMIIKLHSIGLRVLATVCDQGTTNVSAINLLVQNTKEKYLKEQKEWREAIFEIDGKKVVPLYDVPHLLKGIRNNLITKDLIYEMNGTKRTAKWKHITQLYENNPAYKGIKMIKNLTENHCNPEKIPKMKVKYASQLFSQTVGKTMGYLADTSQGERVDIYGDMDGQCKRGLKIKYTGKKLYVGAGYLRMLRSDLFDKGVQPSGIAVHTILPASRLPVVNETLYPKGKILLQNLPSMVCGWVVDAQPGEYILDICAAPGNKTTHLAEMSDNLAFITAIDKTPQKVAKIKENCKTHGITCVNAFAFDSTKCCSEDSKGINDGPPFPPNSFDKVLLDGPCSGLGQRPQLLNKMSPKMLQSYKFVQRKLFSAAVGVLKARGTLVYSTCTVTEDENEGMVAWALEKFTCLRLLPAEPLLGGPGLPNCGLTDGQRVLVQRFGPEDDPLRPVEQIYKDTIGFFIAKFIKTH